MTQQTEVAQVIRLNQEMYNALEREVNPFPMVTQHTTDIQAGFQLGIQRVLAVLRSGFVV